MSEYDEERPMTRRERRMRDMAETGALDLSDALQEMPAQEPESDEAAVSQPVEAEPVSVASDSGEIEISPFNEDGTPRSRREMRQLREEALAERAAAEAAAEPEPPVEEEAPEEEASEAEPESAPESGSESASEEASDETASEPATPADHVVSEAAPVDPSPSEEPDATAEPEGPAETEDGEDQAVESELEKSEVEESEVEKSELEESELEESVAEESEVEEAEAEEAEAEEAADAVPDFDTLMAPPTEPFSVEELREAAQASTTEFEVDSEVKAEEPSEEQHAVEEKPKRRFWQRSKSESTPAVEEIDTVGVAAAPPIDFAPAEKPIEAPAADAPAADEPIPAPKSAFPSRGPAEPVPAVEPEVAENEVSKSGDSDPETAQAEAAQKYSFPDIQPPEEWRSVFDDPTSRAANDRSADAKGDFDDLISRAVAQEGAAGASNTSALILPTMPEDTGGLTGPIGATGELYVTGSIELPKSFGETGGHSALHDSLKFEPIAMPTPEEPMEASSEGPMPVSAKHAVSARMPSGMPVVAKPTKEKSKLPLVLTLSGGGLLAVVVGLGIWGATNGFFSG